MAEPTVRDSAYELLRSHGMTTIFGNPGSNELHFLEGMPSDFRYILGLHEGTVIGMADGYAMATGRASFVNLHAAAGTGNAMGGLTNAMTAHTPIVVTAGQQVRSQVGVGALLSNVDATVLPRPLVKWSGEPLDPSDTVRMLGEAIHTATLHPQGPVYLSVPYDDWAREAGPNAPTVVPRSVHQAASLSADQLATLKDRLESARTPALVVGADVDAVSANAAAVVLAEKLAMPVWIAPSPSRCPFPTRHPLFRGVLPASIAGIADTLAEHDLVLVVGAPVFRYHQYEPGVPVGETTTVIQLTSDAGEAARAPFGTAVVAGVSEALDALAAAVSPTARAAPAPRHRAAVPPDDGSGALAPDTVFETIFAGAPGDAIYVKESTSTTTAFWQQADLRQPGSFYFPAAGGLGFGMPAAVGVQLARPDRRVIALIGDGSAHYGITALWTAAEYDVPVVFVVLKNAKYAALEAFATKMQVSGVAGLDIGGVDFTSIASGYGVPAVSVATASALAAALSDSLAAHGPTLIEVRTKAVDPFS